MHSILDGCWAKPWGFAVAALVLSWVSLSHAQEPVEVVAESTRETPAGDERFRLTTSGSAETARERNAQSLADALRLQPSVSVQQTTPGQGSIHIRGFSGRSVTHVVDGVAVNTAFFRAGNNPYISLIDPYSLALIEVIPGPGSVAYGSDALGGALVMRTQLTGYTDRPQLVSGFYQSISSNPLGTVSHVDLARSSERWVLDLGLTAFAAGDVVPGEERRVPRPDSYLGLVSNPDGRYDPATSRAQLGTGFEQYFANATLRTKLAPGLEWIQRGQWSLRPELLRYDQLTPGFSEAPPQAIDAASRPLFRWMVASELVHRTRDSWYDKWSTQVAWQRIGEHTEERDYAQLCSLPLPDEDAMCPAPTVLAAAPTLEFERNISDKLSANTRLRIGAPRSTTVTNLGLDVSHDVISSSAQVLDLPSAVRASASPRYPDGSSLTEFGAFVTHRQRLLDDLQGSMGVRGASFLLDIKPRGAPEPSDAERLVLTDVAFSAGLLWEAVNGVALLGNVGRGLRSPNVQDLASLGARAGGRFQIPNSNLSSETSLGADVGVRTELRNVRGQIGLFWLRQDRAIVLAPATIDGAELTPEGELVVQSVNASSIETWGSEAYYEIDVTARYTVYGRWLLMRGTQTNPENTDLPRSTPADRVPPMQGNLGVRHELNDSLTIDVFANGRMRQQRLNDPTNLDDSRIPPGGTPGFVTYHAAADLRLDSKRAVRLAVDNITNELALEHGSGFYRPGFSVTASIDGSF